MEINSIIQLVEKKAAEIAAQEISDYSKSFPEINLTEEAKEAVKVRSLSQLTLQLSKFRFKEDLELEDQFNSWFEANEEDDLRKACRHCLDSEAKKIRESAKGKMSSLDSYLKRHLGDAHQID